ncbi:hypothetical protein RYX36_006895 [Vicia faba]
MKPSSQLRYKTCACKNATPSIYLFDKEGSDSDVFINGDAKCRFTDNINNKKWIKLCQHPNPYNVQLVKEFYSNLNLANKNNEVMVMRIRVSFSGDTINMILRLRTMSNEYQAILSRADETEYEVYMQSICNANTTWVESEGEKFVIRMDLKPVIKAWYQFVKHIVKPTTHNETINK